MTSLITTNELIRAFPHDKFGSILPNQQAAFESIAQHGSLILETPTGSGKTAIGMTYLRALARYADGPVYYIVPTKTLVDQVHAMFPETTRMYGRNEYSCLYFEPEEHFRADEIPCYSLECEHRVDPETGNTVGESATPCPYYQARYQLGQGQIIVCTMAYYLFTHVFNPASKPPYALVIDEVHQIPRVVRGSLSFDISDYHLSRAATALRKIGEAEAADHIAEFVSSMKYVLRQKPSGQSSILNDHDIAFLLEPLGKVDEKVVQQAVKRLIASGTMDPLADREALKQLEQIGLDLGRYVRALDYALPEHGATRSRGALNYVTYAYKESLTGDERVQFKLVVRGYYVAPLIRRLLPENTLVYSGTIGDPEIFGYESGIKLPFVSLGSDFPIEHTRLLIPSDTPNLAAAKRDKREPTRVLRRIARACNDLSSKQIRSLVIVTSEREREKFLRMCAEESVDVVSYGSGYSPREAIAAFKGGEGQVLTGTVSQYGEGVDLPGNEAAVTFFLRPGYPNPSDPNTQFEERRFGGQRWAIWNWRVTIEALQVRGRNIRSANDRGVTIFVSQQFRSFLFGSMPQWLRPAYRSDLSLDECVAEAIELLST